MARCVRHHYVPQFLLKLFAENPTHKRPRLWVYSLRTEPRLARTREVAAERDFHGVDAAEIEGRLSVEEAKWATVCRSIAAGRDPHEFANEFWQFVRLAAIRTASMRGLAAGFAAQVQRRAFERLDGEEGVRLRVLRAQRTFDAAFEELLARIHPSEVVRLEGRREQLREAYMESARQVDPVLRDAVKNHLLDHERVRGEVATHLLRRMVAMLADPESLFVPSNMQWRVERHETPCLLLTDSPVVSFSSGTGTVAGPGMPGVEIDELYVAISPQVLVGMKTTEGPFAFDTKTFNRTAVSWAREQFFGPEFREEWAALVPLVGSERRASGQSEVEKASELVIRTMERAPYSLGRAR